MVKLWIRNTIGVRELKEVVEASDINNQYAELFFAQEDIHPNDGGSVAPNSQVAKFSSSSTDDYWSVSSNKASFKGKSKIIIGDINMRATDQGTSNYWSKPVIKVTEEVSGRIFWFADLAMQDNTAYDGSVYYSGTFRHLNPPENPIYIFEYYNEESRTATLIPDEKSSIVLEAKKI